MNVGKFIKAVCRFLDLDPFLPRTGPATADLIDPNDLLIKDYVIPEIPSYKEPKNNETEKKASCEKKNIQILEKKTSAEKNENAVIISESEMIKLEDIQDKIKDDEEDDDTVDITLFKEPEKPDNQVIIKVSLIFYHGSQFSGT